MTYAKRLVLIAFAAALSVCGPVSLYAQDAGEGATRMIRDPATEEMYNRGMQLLAEEKPKEALSEFNGALTADPTYVEAYIGRGDALLAIEDYPAAIISYSRAIEIDQNSAAAYNGRGEASLKVGQIDAASTDFTQALQLAPNNPKILSNLGHVLINYAREPQGALRRLNDAIAGNDQDARAFRDRGFAHAMLQDFEAAEADLRRAAEIEPENYENYAVMANIFLFQENVPGAIEALGRAIAAYKPEKPADPKIYLMGYLSRADAWLRVGDEEKDQQRSQAAYQNAIADAEFVIRDNPDRFPEAGMAYFRKGRAQRMLQQFSEAVDSLTLALETIPPGQEANYVSDAYMYRGICWYYIGSHDLARGDFEQASAVGSGFNDPRVYLWIGFTHHQEGDYRDAIKAYSEAIAKAPKFALAHTNKGRAYMDLEEYNNAIESFNDAIRSEPSVGEHYYNVGFAYAQLGDWTKAEHFLNIALRKKNPEPKMYRLMATVLRERGRDELADEYEQKADAAQPQQAAGQ
ncbi:MAG TPA: tetratricopeptide repeat protein [Lacipirellula sp.]